MRVAITGGTGVIGGALRESLVAAGHVVHVVSRRPPARPGDIHWDPARGTIDAATLEGVHAVVNLAGESLARRWTDDAKRRIRESRVLGTRLISETLASLRDRPAVLVSSSGAGIYGNRGDELLDERSAPGADFLARLAADWEGATAPASSVGVRVVHLRQGVVLTKRGGMLAELLLPFRLGAGGPMGSGRQWLSWISLSDTVRAIEFLIGSESATGAFNITSPNPVTNREFAREFARALRRPALIPTPAFALRAMFGREMADAALLGGQRVIPRRLTEAGFEFDYPQLRPAIEAALSDGAVVSRPTARAGTR